VVDEHGGELVADALCTSAVETAESTPPDSAEMTRPSPTCARMRSTCSAMTLPLFQSAGRPAPCAGSSR
jgi:hypothetical protein